MGSSLVLDKQDYNRFLQDRKQLILVNCLGKPQLENLCFERAMDTIYQYTYDSHKSHKIRQIIGIFHQIYTLCII